MYPPVGITPHSTKELFVDWSQPQGKEDEETSPGTNSQSTPLEPPHNDVPLNAQPSSIVPTIKQCLLVGQGGVRRLQWLGRRLAGYGRVQRWQGIGRRLQRMGRGLV